ncbi:MAG: hypothetical protein E6K18_07340 [Methanobacteriota archaeon]|nr:MAG: hypothetical protein E6K18_07340 [Euryarchaeota archaeon]
MTDGMNRLHSLSRLVRFLDQATHPMTTTEQNSLLDLGGERNVPRYMRAFIQLGVAEECHKVPRAGRGPGPWQKTYRRTVRLAEVNPEDWVTIKNTLGGTVKGQLILMVKKERPGESGELPVTLDP